MHQLHLLNSVPDEMFGYEHVVAMEENILLAATTLGVCYRSHEYHRMIASETKQTKLPDGRQVFVSSITYNKNTSRKGTGMVLWFPSQLSPFMVQLININSHFARPNVTSLWINEKGTPVAEGRLTSVIKKAFKAQDSNSDMNMEKLRFIKSAYIWEKYQSGIITEDKMLNLCKLYDRNIETWEKSYTFTNHIDRVPDISLMNDIENNFQ
jgi:hypothetical protein